MKETYSLALIPPRLTVTKPSEIKDSVIFSLDLSVEQQDSNYYNIYNLPLQSVE